MKRTIHYVLSTHWDREWHQTFQDFRYRLVKLIDKVIDGWESDELKGPFQTDGQAIILEDYLEVRPERRLLVEKLAQEGKFVIGPWYVMPDEFTVSGESLIRNLRLGREIARSFGASPSKAGFVCDIFGHNSQMPQIFAGFGIQGAFLWRGVNLSDRRNFIWAGADGTETACLRFGPIAYCDFAIRVRMGHDGINEDLDPENFVERLETYLQGEAAATDVDPILMFDGGDHQGWDQRAYLYLDTWMKQENAEFSGIHSSLDTYLDEMLPQRDRIQTRIAGELREPGWGKLDPQKDELEMDQQWLIPGVLSSRINLKQANARCQTNLCLWAEPTASFANALIGEEYPQGLFNLAWRYLLQNHPHDSIDGCSIDQVHKDMEYRFDQCEQISRRIMLEATHHIASAIEGSTAEGELQVTVFNPIPTTSQRVVELPLKIPPEWPKFNEFFGFEPKPAFRIYGSDGKELAYQRLSQDMGRIEFRLRDTRFPENVTYDLVKVAVELTIPALGYTTLTVKAGEKGEFTRHPDNPGLAVSECAMENDSLHVEIEPNGTLTLTDKRSGQIYHRLLTLEDSADIGDGWYHGQAVNDQVFVSTPSRATTALVHNGPQMAAFKVQVYFSTPEAFNFRTMHRTESTRDLVVEHTITLRKDQDFIEVETRIENTTSDHRLRVLLPSGANTDTYLADSAFDVVERSIALREDNHLYRELEVETKPQQSWTAVSDKERGLAVVADGLLESAVRDLPEHPLALTLFRGTRRTVGTNGEPGGQLHGRLTFKYWIAPISGKPDYRRLCEMGQQVSAGYQIVQHDRADMKIYRQEKILPRSESFLEVRGDAVMTSARMVDKGLEVRMFNPLKTASPITLKLAKALQFGHYQTVDLESNPQSAPTAFAEAVDLTLRPKQILTLRFTA